MDGINGIALTRAVVDQAGASALLNVDMALAMQAFKKQGNVHAGVIEPLAEWGKSMGQDARDKLTQMSIKTLSWFFSEIDPDMYHVLNHPDWD